ncbi:hypothetical protein MJO28_006400 [Puccinia striiformis f. sp. tritici]|uniref:Uncharacterized protein n=1 Tax=Puccinia striiformis f. sp. tritici TaxID=168172 RepID=A0ACC0EGY6_9BASI|nr:hypothetical protein MJO28_006400 [Puccinia striiformis f. sp. tritici]
MDRVRRAKPKIWGNMLNLQHQRSRLTFLNDEGTRTVSLSSHYLGQVEYPGLKLSRSNLSRRSGKEASASRSELGQRFSREEI